MLQNFESHAIFFMSPRKVQQKTSLVPWKYGKYYAVTRANLNLNKFIDSKTWYRIILGFCIFPNWFPFFATYINTAPFLSGGYASEGYSAFLLERWMAHAWTFAVIGTNLSPPDGMSHSRGWYKKMPLLCVSTCLDFLFSFLVERIIGRKNRKNATFLNPQVRRMVHSFKCKLC